MLAIARSGPGDNGGVLAMRGLVIAAVMLGMVSAACGKDEPAPSATPVDPELNDSTLPVISGLQVIDITANSATVVWLTDDRTIGQVFYGPATSHGSTVSDSPSYGRSHAVRLTDLTEDEDYGVRVRSKNRAQLTAYSDSLTFRAEDQPWVEVVPDTVTVVGGGGFEFGINVRDAQNVAALIFALSYDPSAVEILSVRKSRWFDQTQGHIILNEWDDPSSGLTKWSLTWAVVFENGTPVGTLADGEGEVVHIRARDKGTGTSSSLHLVDADLNGDCKPETRILDYNRREVPTHVRSGVVVEVAGAAY
jgi:hypothetical protein